jgi:hypothetical protein
LCCYVTNRFTSSASNSSLNETGNAEDSLFTTTLKPTTGSATQPEAAKNSTGNASAKKDVRKADGTNHGGDVKEKRNMHSQIMVKIRVARWFLFKSKIPIWVNFGRP